MTKNEQIIARMNELIAILETNVTVVRADLSMSLGDPIDVTVSGATWIHIYTVDIEMHKALK